MSRKIKSVAGIKQPLAAWRQAADALLEGSTLPDRVESLKELVTDSLEWRSKARAFFRQRALDVTGSKMRSRGVGEKPTVKEAAVEKMFKGIPDGATTENNAELAAIYKRMYTPSNESEAAWYRQRGKLGPDGMIIPEVLNA